MSQNAKRRLLAIFAIFFLRASIVSAALPTSQPVADWSQLPPEQWPQLVLTNDASFEGHTPLHGASAFLMRMPDGEILAGTAKHLIKKPGGVDPPILLPDLDHVLTHWRLFPRTKAGLAIDAKGIVERATNETGHDWLLLHLADASQKLPATPLIPRDNPVQIGETVYLIGVSYSDRDTAQNVYKGVVTARPQKNYFTYEFTPPVHIAGFSGAPIVDARGLLIGHGVSMSKALKKTNNLEIEFGGEDASLALQLWQHRNDPPATRPADALQLELPDGWNLLASKSPNVVKFAACHNPPACVELFASPRADFADDVDLVTWAKLVKSNAAKTSTLVNRVETKLKSNQIGDRATIEYEVSGELKDGVKVRYRMIMLEINGCFCKFNCWTAPTHWDDAQAKFEEVVRGTK